MKRMAALLLCLVILFSLCGCTSLYERSYSSVKAHQTQAASDEDASILRAETYADIVSCVQHYVSLGQSTGTIHVYQYSGDIGADLHNACQEVITEDPLGAYAVSGITFEYTRIVSYYECTFSFTYSRTLDEIASIVNVYGYGSIRDRITSALQSYAPILTLQTLAFYADRSKLLSLVQEAYYASPATAMGYPEVSISMYPDSGDVRIVELSFSYRPSRQTLLSRAESVASTAAQLVGQDTAADATVAWLLYSRLMDQTTYEPTGSSGVYQALCSGNADSEGIALAYATLCDYAGISCSIIRGTLDGTPHCWNLITLDNTSWQLDLTREDSENAFLHNDEVMVLLGYNWSQEDTPACDGEEYLPEAVIPAVPVESADVEITPDPVNDEPEAIEDQPAAEAPSEPEGTNSDVEPEA